MHFLPIPKQTKKEHREELLDPLFCVNFDAVCGLFLMEDNYYIFFCHIQTFEDVIHKWLPIH